MAASALIDAGVILALVDRSDGWHALSVEAYNRCRLPLLTTEAVLAEVFHLTERNLRDVRGVWRLLHSSAIHMSPIANEELPQIQALMDAHSDRPMNFADATMVHLAARERLSVILTVDHDDFETYRINGRKKFTILPPRPRSESSNFGYDGRPTEAAPSRPSTSNLTCRSSKKPCSAWSVNCLSRGRSKRRR
jgi:predicted nucleic acid-binding protein